MEINLAVVDYGRPATGLRRPWRAQEGRTALPGHARVWEGRGRPRARCRDPGENAQPPEGRGEATMAPQRAGEANMSSTAYGKKNRMVGELGTSNKRYTPVYGFKRRREQCQH